MYAIRSYYVQHKKLLLNVILLLCFGLTGLQAQESISVITSYSIHYTKLYEDMIFSHISGMDLVQIQETPQYYNLKH